MLEKQVDELVAVGSSAAGHPASCEQGCEQGCEQAAPRQRKGREKRNSPLHPLIEKREGKEDRPDTHRSGLSRTGAYAICVGVPRARVRGVVSQTIAEARAFFHGTVKDSKLWAKIAWRVGPEFFSQVMEEARSQIRARNPMPPWSEWPRIFQNVLNIRCPKPESEGGAK